MVPAPPWIASPIFFVSMLGWLSGSPSFGALFGGDCLGAARSASALNNTMPKKQFVLRNSFTSGRV
jgi:hypothetical protein